jgi:hypothetical protein
VPFTPFHMGPGLLLKALLQGSFSLMVFAWAQIIMDIQPLVVMITGEGHLHGFSHTYVGATLIGIGSALTGKYAAELGLRLLGRSRDSPISWPVAIVSAVIGSYSHVLLDSVMHTDIEPFAPFILDNRVLGLVSVAALHEFCVYSGLVGISLYFAISHWLDGRKHRK